MNETLLFVYGTLRRETRCEMHDLLARHAEFIGAARYQGKLYRIDAYPGVVPSQDQSDEVQGELYRLKDAERLLPLLDRYEGCAPECANPAEYVRRRETVRLVDGTRAQAWIYLYNWPTDACEWIRSGDFLSEAP